MARHGPGAVLASLSVLAVAGGFAIYTARSVRSGPGDTHRFRASFASASGLAAGDAVTVGGITVGRIDAVTLDTATFDALVDFSVDDTIPLHRDAAVAVGSAVAGGAALTLDPGHDASPLPADAVITRATPALSLEQQVGDYIFGAGGLSSD